MTLDHDHSHSHAHGGGHSHDIEFPDDDWNLYQHVQRAEGLNAIVVDDNPTAREILQAYLESFSFRVDTAENAENLFQKIQETADPYSLIVLDWLMPGMNGTEAAAKIKTDIKPLMKV